MTARSSLFLAALMLPSSSPAQTTRPVQDEPRRKTYAIRHVFRPGEKLLLISKTQSESTFRSQEGAPGGSHTCLWQIEWQLTAAPADNGKVVLVRIKLLRRRSVSKNGGQKKTTDSSKPETLSPKERERLPVILKAVFTAEVDEKGGVRELTIPDEVVAAVRKGAKVEEDSVRNIIFARTLQLFESLTVHQPSGPVFVGEAWTVKAKRPDGQAESQAEWKLVRVERTPAGRIATITFKLPGDPDAASRGITQKQEGQARYNIDRQRFVSWKVEASESSGDGRFEMKKSVSMELRDLPSPPTRPAGGSKHTIRHVFRPGNFLLVLTTISEQKTMGADGAEQPRVHRDEGRMALKVTRSPVGGGTIVRIDHPLPGREEGKLTCVAELDDLGKVRKFSVDEAGLDKLLKGADANRPGLREERRKHLQNNLGGLLEELTFYQPPGAVSVGETWKVQRSWQEDPEREETECKLIRIEQTPAGRIATILLTGKIERTPPASRAEKAVSGEVRFNLDRQEFVSARSEMRSVLQVRRNPSQRREQKTTLELELRRRSEPSTRPGADKSRPGAKRLRKTSRSRPPP